MGEHKQFDKQSLFQRAMANMNASGRDYSKHRFNSYDQREKSPPSKRSNQHVSTEVPATAAIDQTLLGEQVLFVRSGLQRKAIKRLKRGEYPCRMTVDLHGMRAYQAETYLNEFLTDAVWQNISCVLIIHGKGHHSENNKGIIKPLTINWLKASAEVMAFCSAQPKDGGTGALYVLLKRTIR